MDKGILLIDFAANLSSVCFWSSMHSGAHYSADDILPLDLLSNHCSSTSNGEGAKRKWNDGIGIKYPENPFIALGVAHSPSSSVSKMSYATTAAPTIYSANEIDEGSSSNPGLKCQLQLGSMSMLSPKKSSVGTPWISSTGKVVDLQLSLSTGSSASALANSNSMTDQYLNNLESSVTASPVISNEEGSTMSCWIFGKRLQPCLPNLETPCNSPKRKMHYEPDPISVALDLPSTTMQALKNPVACTSGASNLPKRNNRTKYCQFQGCTKGARGASGLCIAHGGGRRCQRLGCEKGAEGRTIYCKAHGGGHRCQHLGCTRSAEGRTDYCIAHGGGRRCSYPNCIRAARGRSSLCIRHGGGKRCQKENCTKSAEGSSALCISHGGGRRCHFMECTKGAQGNTLFCKAHGGGKRCTFLGCTKGAEGSTSYCKGHGGGKRCTFQGGGVCTKSVHGGTPFCVAHGGGKRCAILECPRSARGRTSFCVRHGGGKRCKIEGCGKSAQGSTDFCKAHGGGKRCIWGQVGSIYGVGELLCDKYARGKTCLCSAHNALVQDHCVRGGGILGPYAIQAPSLIKPEDMTDGETGSVLNPGSDWDDFVGNDGSDSKGAVHCHLVSKSESSVPEGRVRGGSLIPIFGNSSGFENSNTGNQGTAIMPDQGAARTVTYLRL